MKPSGMDNQNRNPMFRWFTGFLCVLAAGLSLTGCKPERKIPKVEPTPPGTNQPHAQLANPADGSFH
jgi:hypothetical protein